MGKSVFMTKSVGQIGVIGRIVIANMFVLPLGRKVRETNVGMMMNVTGRNVGMEDATIN